LGRHNPFGRADRDLFFLHPDSYQADETRNPCRHGFSVGDAMDASKLPARRLGFGRMAVSTEDTIVANMNKSPNHSMKPTAPLRNDLWIFATTSCRGLSPSRRR